MATLTEEQVRHIAKLAKLACTDAEVKKMGVELASILDYIAILSELDTEKIPPTAQVTGLENILREDEVRPTEATKDALLGCSPLPLVNDHIETLSAHG